MRQKKLIDYFDFQRKSQNFDNMNSNSLLFGVVALVLMIVIKILFGTLLYPTRYLFKILILKKINPIKSKNNISLVFDKNSYMISELSKLGVLSFSGIVMSRKRQNRLPENFIFFSNSLLLLSVLLKANLFDYFYILKNSFYLKNTFRIIKCDGIYNLFDFYIKKYKPAKLITFNDHTSYALACKEVAEKYGLVTVYIQHASIGKNFPDLSFTKNILFNKISLERYNNPHNKEVILLYDLRLLRFSKCKIIKKVANVLICVNKFDKIRNITSVVNLLKNKYNLLVRFHPTDFRKRQFEKLNSGIKISKNSLVYDLSWADLLIANESSIFIEAAYVGLRMLICEQFSNSIVIDNFGYKENKLIHVVKSDDELLNAIPIIKEPRNKIWNKYFGDLNKISQTRIIFKNEIFN